MMRFLRSSAPALLSIVLLGVVFFLGGGGVAYDTDAADFNKVYWQETIARKGAEKAYAEFLEKNARVPLERQHLLAHVMGERIYEAQGAKGIAVCDGSFGFACYHGLFARAISEGGTDTIRTLSDACIATYGELGTGCQHGIGHGILEYVGYEQIARALELCNTETAQKVPLLGCTSGVFMEYNWPLAGTDDAVAPSRRAFVQERPYEPCTLVPSEFQNSCYLELGQWYTRVFENSPELVETLCMGRTGDTRTYCFLGAGVSFAFLYQYDLARGIDVCDEFSTSDAVSCRAGLSWGFYSVPEHTDAYASACALSVSEDEARCRRLSDLTEGLDTYRTR